MVVVEERPLGKGKVAAERLNVCWTSADRNSGTRFIVRFCSRNRYKYLGGNQRKLRLSCAQSCKVSVASREIET